MNKNNQIETAENVENTSPFDPNVELIPAKLVCIIRNGDDEIYAIIHSCLQNPKKMSVLTYRQELEYVNKYVNGHNLSPFDIEDDSTYLTPVYHKVSVDCFHKNILMIPYHKNSRFLMEIIDINKWGDIFS